MISGNLNFLEPSGPLQACNGTDLPFFYKLISYGVFISNIILIWYNDGLLNMRVRNEQTIALFSVCLYVCRHSAPSAAHFTSQSCSHSCRVFWTSYVERRTRYITAYKNTRFDTHGASLLTFWRRNYFFNFSTLCIQNVNNTGTKQVRIMKQTAF